MSSLTSDIEITLDGQEYTLRPTLKAATNVSRHFGGFIGAYQALGSGNLEAFQYIIKAGLTSKSISTDDLNDAVWRTGLGKLSAPVSKFVSILQNGGRDPDLDEPKGDDEDGEGNAGN